MKYCRCIAIETSTQRCSVAVSDGDRIECIEMADSRETSRQLYSTVRQLMGRIDLRIDELQCIAFGCGPGSFTGVRVAAAAAQALAYSQALPVCRVSSLAAIAAEARPAGLAGPVAVALDARMGEAYVGIYDVREGRPPVQLMSDRLVRPADFRLTIDGNNILAAGNGWQAWPEMSSNNADKLAEVQPDVWPHARSVLAIATTSFAAGNTVEPADALPNYVREQVTQ